MELSIVVERTDTGYRAASSEPMPSVAEAATRDEALALLHDQVKQRMQNDIEVLTWHFPERDLIKDPIWPDDEVTDMWIEAMAETRRNALSQEASE